MISKHLVDAARCRRVPRQFSWVDQRLVRDGHISRCSHRALALYRFLVTVCDADGLSYYAQKSLCQRLNMNVEALRQARHELLRAELIAYAHPLYQVLALDAVRPCAPVRTAGSVASSGTTEAVWIGEVLQSMLGGAR